MLAVSRVAYSYIVKRFPYRYEGGIGVGDRGLKQRENTSRFVISLFFNRKTDQKKTFFCWKPDKKTDRKKKIRYSVHNTDRMTCAIAWFVLAPILYQ